MLIDSEAREFREETEFEDFWEIYRAVTLKPSDKITSGGKITWLRRAHGDLALN